MHKALEVSQLVLEAGADPGFDQGGPQIVTGLKLPFWGLSFGAGPHFGGQGGPGPPLDPPLRGLKIGTFYAIFAARYRPEWLLNDLLM